MQRLIARTGLPAAGISLLLGTFVTTVGNGMHTLTVGKLLYDQTGSAAAFGGVIVFEQVVSFLLQFVAGPWVDQGDPKRTCVRVELFRGVAVSLCALMLWASPTVIGWVFAMSVAIRVAHPFYRAATFSLGPAAVPPESLGRYNGWSNIALQGGQLVGLVLAAPILTYGGPQAAFLVNGVTFLLSAVAVSTVSVAHVAKAPLDASWWRQLVNGWGEIVTLLRGEVGLAWHLLLCTIDQVAVSLFNVALVPLSIATFGTTAWGLSLVDGAYTVGAMATAPIAHRLATRHGTRASAILGIGAQASGFALLAGNLHPAAALAAAFVIGAGNTVSWTVLTTALQLRVGRQVKGRISTVRSLLITMTGALWIPLVSRMGDVSLGTMLVTSAAICGGYATLALVLGRPRALGGQLLGSATDGSPT